MAKETDTRDRVRVVGIGGSLSPASSSLAALKIAIEGAEQAGAVTQVFDIRSLDLPMYNPSAKDVPASVRRMADAVYEADGLLWSSPLYHGTISGSFKNALDWLQVLSDRTPPFLTDKVVGLLSAAGGTQGLQAVNTMEFVVRALRGWAVPLVIPIAEAWRVFDNEGFSKDPKLTELLHTLGAEVARAARQFSRRTTTTPEAAKAEAELQPISREEVVASEKE
ncbi:MAG TPA: NADPH-dependent FMN reductase [Thermoanaerobaculia bacterium]